MSGVLIGASMSGSRGEVPPGATDLEPRASSSAEKVEVVIEPIEESASTGTVQESVPAQQIVKQHTVRFSDVGTISLDGGVVYGIAGILERMGDAKIVVLNMPNGLHRGYDRWTLMQAGFHEADVLLNGKLFDGLSRRATPQMFVRAPVQIDDAWKTVRDYLAVREGWRQYQFRLSHARLEIDEKRQRFCWQFRFSIDGVEASVAVEYDVLTKSVTDGWLP